MRIRCVVVETLATTVTPADCNFRKDLGDRGLSALQSEFLGCDIYAWDGILWDEVTAANVTTYLKEDAAILIHSKTSPSRAPSLNSARTVIRDSNGLKAYARVQIEGPSGVFDGHLLADLGRSLELTLSEHKAVEMGLVWKKEQDCGIDDNSLVGTTALRGWATVTISMDDGSGSETPLPGCVEVWTYDGTTGPTTTLASAALITGPAELGAIRIQVQEYLQVGEDEAPGDDEKYDIILGQGAMWKLGVWVDETGRLCKKKRRFRK